MFSRVHLSISPDPFISSVIERNEYAPDPYGSSPQTKLTSEHLSIYLSDSEKASHSF